MKTRIEISKVFFTAAFLGLSLIGCQQLFMNYSEPEWNAVARHSDGREFVTDGKIAIDVSFAELEELPTGQGSTAWFEGALQEQGFAERRELFSITDIRESEDDPDVSTGPGGLVLDSYQIEYIRGKFFGRKVSFWQLRRMDPLVIVVDEKPVGALKVISQS